MITAIAPFRIGDKVIRKSGQATIGVIERIASSGRVYVRWIDSLRPFSGGYGDNHSLIKSDALLLLTEEAGAKRQARMAAFRAAREAQTARTLAGHQARWDNLQPGQKWSLCCPGYGTVYHTYQGDIDGQRQFTCPHCGAVVTRAPQPMVWA